MMEKKIMILDNYDSFTYNLVQMIEAMLSYSIDVHRNDAITVEEVEKYDIIFLSPGPGLPKDAGILIDLIKQYKDKKPIFGVCLGLQAIVEALGGELVNLERVFHGIATPITFTENKNVLFQGLTNPFIAGRYHSWVAKKMNIPEELVITAQDNEQEEIMAIRHKNLPVYAVQFHPESILTPQGDIVVKNFLKQAGAL